MGGYADVSNSEGAYRAVGYLYALRCWLEQKPTPTAAITRTFLHKTDTSLAKPGTDGNPPTVENLTRFLPITFTIEAGQPHSAYKDVVPAFLDMDPPEGQTFQQSLTSNLIPVDIEPDANMAGVVGDVVKSAVAGSAIKHFVSPKKSTELAQDYVILKATGITADQITPGHASQVVEWDSVGNP